MFLLKRKTELLLLISIIGILLQQVSIQPVQGISCYFCDPCSDANDPGIEIQCGPESTHCGIGEAEKPSGNISFFKACVPKGRASSGWYSCYQFRQNPGNHNERMKLCFCDWDLCNEKGGPSARAGGNKTMNGTSNSTSSSLQRKRLSVYIIAAVFSYGLTLAICDW